MAKLQELGYFVAHSTFDAKDYGSFARRKRWYAVCILDRSGKDGSLTMFISKVSNSLKPSAPPVELGRIIVLDDDRRIQIMTLRGLEMQREAGTKTRSADFTWKAELMFSHGWN